MFSLNGINITYNDVRRNWKDFFLLFHSKKDFGFLHPACDLSITPTAVWTTLRHLVAHDRCCLFPRLAGELTAEAQRSVENCVCGSGELAFCIKRQWWGIFMCVYICVCFFVHFLGEHLKPAISPSNSSVHQIVWRYVALLVPLGDIDQRLN